MLAHTEFNGGLGNRLFIGANLYAHSRKHCMCNVDANNRHSAKRYADTLFQNFNKTCGVFQYHLQLFQQNYSQIAGVLPEFVAKLHIPPQPEMDAAFLHIRGGDYVGHRLHHIPLDFYYRRAIRHFPNDTLFYIFTDDIKYAKTQPILQFIRHEFVECDEVTALSKMKQCKRGGICANSSFSWWGAVLDMSRTLVLPSKWTNNPSWNASSQYAFPGAIVEPVEIDVHCIHLPHRTDRLAHIQTLQHRYPYLNLQIVDAEYVPDNGALGCMRSHKQIIQRAKERQLPYVFVIEDDCDFRLEPDQLLDTIIDAIEYLPTVDVVNGCGNLVKFEITETAQYGNTTFLKSPDVRTTHCILYGKSSYDKVLAFPEDTSIETFSAIDEQLNTLGFAYTFPYMAYQLSGHSDIMNMSVEYTNIRKSAEFVKAYLSKDRGNESVDLAPVLGVGTD